MGIKLSKKERGIYTQVKASLRFACMDFDKRLVKRFILWASQNVEGLDQSSACKTSTWDEVGRRVSEAVGERSPGADLRFPGVFLLIRKAVEVHHPNQSLCSVTPVPPPLNTLSKPHPKPSQDCQGVWRLASTQKRQNAPVAAGKPQASPLKPRTRRSGLDHP